MRVRCFDTALEALPNVIFKLLSFCFRGSTSSLISLNVSKLDAIFFSKSSTIFFFSSNCAPIEALASSSCPASASFCLSINSLTSDLVLLYALIRLLCSMFCSFFFSVRASTCLTNSSFAILRFFSFSSFSTNSFSNFSRSCVVFIKLLSKAAILASGSSCFFPFLPIFIVSCE